MECIRKRPTRTKSEELIYQAQSKKAATVNGKLIGMEGDEDLSFLLTGGELLKVRSNSWKKSRFFKLQEDCKTVWHESRKSRRSNQTFSIDDIAEVRPGRRTEELQKYTEEPAEGRCFSIVFKGRRKNLDLVAGTEEEATKWVSSLEKVINNVRNLNSQQQTEHWIFNCMRKADQNSDNKMSLKELKRFLLEINIEVDDTYAEMLFEKCDKSKSGYLEGSEIEDFYKLLTSREEIDVIYGKYAQTGGQMTTRDLLHFLLQEQRESVSLEDAQKLIEKYEVDDIAKEKQHMTKDGFLMYLNQPEGMILNPAHKDVYQDMTRPLSHYFISSSHNTYLMEDQLKGPSSTEAYIRALTKSCRCVELDCWDGSEGEPVIYHGYTLTSKILFKDVIKAIKEYAFKTSEYPVILSLENHCSMEQQKIMAEHLTSILGDALLTKPLGDQVPTTFPALEELKGRFLIKGKKLNSLEDAFAGNAAGEETVSEDDEAADILTDEEKKEKESKLKLAKELSDLVIYCKSVHFHGFDHARDNQAFYEMCSFKESKAEKLAGDSANEFIHHNVNKLSRVYPSGSRTDSSNYNPVPLWVAGCQTVALNFQTPSAEMDLNQGLFLPNGKTGYILKPTYLRDEASEFDPITLTRGPWLQHKTLHVMIISAQQLPKLGKKESSIVDPLVKVEIYGVQQDVASKQTHHIDNNGFSPMWNENFQFDICVPELALVRFVVEDYDAVTQNDLIGQYTVPFSSLQNGYRHVPLLNNSGDIIPSARLFVHIMAVDGD
ncbi:1-phosphatidylinositol 4,5-bisphosphate phosphodiesterase delta-1-like isoform X1 [Brienomyrus brachyistius]|uniref:1-phosphatidylinositol 4,5-bisphosphate phosphodiesterase delta-1-like isoform X1 n=2 Tax=Brienomyrus brachyistius TaxID=42636 RepID=UPI0020B2C57C|nr:1-phosphatidylinositol 4,5-bisphosphate phosphodiesterase delta-1-like isoform X1 [Brienomyrus brachyistius]